jgi:type II secretory pathway predicted ATPase ExeA
MQRSSVLTKYAIDTIPSEQLTKFQEQTIRHPRFNKIIDAIALAHRRRKGLIIIGESGAGKSTILEYYEKKLKLEPSDLGDFKKVVLIKIPASPTLKNVTSALLDELGDEEPEKGTLDGMQRRVARKVEQLGVEMIMIDEFQDLLYTDTSKRMKNVGNYVKHIGDKYKVSVILAGLENARSVLSGHPELKRRFMATAELKAFEARAPEELAYFQQYLSIVEKQIGFQSINLGTESMAWRMYYATHGLPGNIASIVETAIDLAAEDQKLKMAHFIDAYELVINDPKRKRVNPFSYSATDIRNKVLKEKLK